VQNSGGGRAQTHSHAWGPTGCVAHRLSRLSGSIESLSLAKRQLSVQPRSTARAAVAHIHSVLNPYLAAAVFLATSTLVRLASENWYLHNRKYWFCASTRLCARSPVCLVRRGVVDSHRSTRVPVILCPAKAPSALGTESTAFLMHQSSISLALAHCHHTGGWTSRTSTASSARPICFSLDRRLDRFRASLSGTSIGQGNASRPLENALDHWLYTLSGLLFFLGAKSTRSGSPGSFLHCSGGLSGGCGPRPNAVNVIAISEVIPASMPVRRRGAVVFWQESRGRKRWRTGFWASPSPRGEFCGSPSIS